MYITNSKVITFMLLFQDLFEKYLDISISDIKGIYLKNMFLFYLYVSLLNIIIIIILLKTG